MMLQLEQRVNTYAKSSSQLPAAISLKVCTILEVKRKNKVWRIDIHHVTQNPSSLFPDRMATNVC